MFRKTVELYVKSVLNVDETPPVCWYKRITIWFLFIPMLSYEVFIDAPNVSRGTLAK
jgi:hypothetical protein